MLTVSRKALGSPKDLAYDSGTVRWSTDRPSSWVIGDETSEWDISHVFETLGKDPPVAIPPEYAQSMDGLAMGRIPWPLIIPPAVLKEHVERIDGELDDALESLGDYADVLVSSRRVLAALQPGRIDLAALRVGQGQATTGVLDSFEPGPDFMCPPPTYSHATATGRLTVRTGPRILTLQKEHRRILASRFDGGRVMQVDFVSLEPRVLRLLSDGFAPVDIYSDVSERLGGAANRRQVKLATLKLLYGSGRAGIVEDIGSISSKSIRGIEDYFGLPSLRARLAAELGRSGMIRSHWGRPLPEATETHLLVSHFTQSTAVDVALGGFGDMLERIRGEDLDVVPCYVLHDALLLDVHPDAQGRLSEIVAEGIEIDGLGHFEVSLSPAYLSEE